MSNILNETVTEVRHWTDTLFSFRATRDPGFRFAAGEFAMVGLDVGGKPLMRPYSVVSAPYEDHLEFLSIKVPDGPLTSRLQHVRSGDPILVNRRTTGTLLLGNLLPGRRLWLFATGTGLAPFLSIIRDPEVYGRFEKVVLTHTVRGAAELAYREDILHDLPANEFFGEDVAAKLVYYPTVTREPFHPRGRATDLLRSGRLLADLADRIGEPTELDPAVDRAMICGNPEMTRQMADHLAGLGFQEGSNARPGHFVIEKAFVQR